MTIISAPPEADLASDFEALGAFLKDHPAIKRLMSGRRIVNIPLAGTTPGERLAELHDVARELGTAVEWNGGVFATALHFGGVTLEAHHNPDSVIRVQDARRRAEVAA
jgi:hypothetical protein